MALSTSAFSAGPTNSEGQVLPQTRLSFPDTPSPEIPDTSDIVRFILLFSTPRKPDLASLAPCLLSWSYAPLVLPISRVVETSTRKSLQRSSAHDVHASSQSAHRSADTVPFPWSLAASEPNDFDPQLQLIQSHVRIHAASRSAGRTSWSRSLGRGWGKQPRRGGAQESWGTWKGRGNTWRT